MEKSQTGQSALIRINPTPIFSIRLVANNIPLANLLTTMKHCIVEVVDKRILRHRPNRTRIVVLHMWIVLVMRLLTGRRRRLMGRRRRLMIRRRLRRMLMLIVEDRGSRVPQRRINLSRRMRRRKIPWRGEGPCADPHFTLTVNGMTFFLTCQRNT
jgi:hypothetical protein